MRSFFWSVSADKKKNMFNTLHHNTIPSHEGGTIHERGTIHEGGTIHERGTIHEGGVVFNRTHSSCIPRVLIV